MTLPATVTVGEGFPIVLLLHGIGGNGAGFAPVQARLAQAGYRAVAWDMPGYGASATVEPYDFAHLAHACVGLIRAFDAPCILVGHSLGGMVAQEVIARAPTAASALVLVATSAAFGRPDGNWQAEYVRARTAPLDAGGSMADMAEEIVPQLLSPGASAAVREAARRSLAAVPEATYRSALAALVRFDRRADLARIAVPTLVVAGAEDKTAPPVMMQNLATRIRGARFVAMPHAGHLLPLEQPEPFARILIEFIQNLKPQSARP